MYQLVTSPKIDVLMCVGSRDVEGLFVDSLLYCWKNFSLLNHLFIITPDKGLVQEKIKDLEIFKNTTILADKEVLDSSLYQEDGWYKQQIIKLNAAEICKTRFVACLGSDTLLLQRVDQKDLFSSSGLPILYYRKYNEPSPHFSYEQLRLKAIERILQVRLERAQTFVDFILDFTIWDTEILILLKQYLMDLYGSHVFKVLSPGKCGTLAKKREFGEWSLYASFILDVLRYPIEVKGFEEDYFFQIHSQKDFHRFEHASKIVHLVAKEIDFHQIKSRLTLTCSPKIDPV